MSTGPPAGHEPAPTDRARVRAAKRRISDALADRPEVVGIGIGREGVCYHVAVRVREAVAEIPEEVDGVEVRVVIVGTVHPRS